MASTHLRNVNKSISEVRGIFEANPMMMMMVVVVVTMIMITMMMMTLAALMMMITAEGTCS
jgi:hypothetical protein